MKFPQLPIGSRFEFQDTQYVKVGPLTAQTLDGQQSRMIPRSALVTPLDHVPETAPAASIAPLEAEAVRQAINQCEKACIEVLKETTPGSEAELQRIFAACRQALGIAK